MAIRTLNLRVKRGYLMAMARHKPIQELPKVRVQINGFVAEHAEKYAAARGQRLYEFVEQLLEQALEKHGIDPYSIDQSAGGKKVDRKQ